LVNPETCGTHCDEAQKLLSNIVKNLSKFYQFQFQPLIALVGLGHFLRCFWYQLAEMYGLAQLGHLKQPRSRACRMNDELALLN